LGYSLCHKGYKCLHVPIGRIYFSQDVIFQEDQFPFVQVPHPTKIQNPRYSYPHIHCTGHTLSSSNNNTSPSHVSSSTTNNSLPLIHMSTPTTNTSPVGVSCK